MSTEPEAPDYREVRRWCIAEARPLTPSDLMRQYRVGYNRAARLLEELELDLVLVSREAGGIRVWDASQPLPQRNAPLPTARRDENGRLERRTLRRPGGQHACTLCGWCISVELAPSCGLHDHHIIPVAAGGSDAEINRVLLCLNHHALAHVLFPLRDGAYSGPTTADGLLEALAIAEREHPSQALPLSRVHAERLAHLNAALRGR